MYIILTSFVLLSQITWADLGLATLAEPLQSAHTEDIFGKHEKLKALHKRVVELPNIAKWIANRPQTAM
jgi:Glutathione S-transferase, C-terminal domain